MKKIFMIMSMMLLTLGVMAQGNDNTNCNKHPRHKPGYVNFHAMKEAGVDSVTISKVMKLGNDTTLCKDREAYNKQVRKILGTETYIKYLETAQASKHHHKGFHGKHGGKHHPKGGFVGRKYPNAPCAPLDAPKD